MPSSKKHMEVNKGAQKHRIKHSKKPPHVSFFGVSCLLCGSMSFICCSTETIPVWERNQFKRMNNTLESRTSTRTWNAIAKLLEYKAAYSIIARHAPRASITHLRASHVGLFTPGAKAPSRTASAADGFSNMTQFSDSPMAKSVFFFVFWGKGSLGRSWKQNSVFVVIATNKQIEVRNRRNESKRQVSCAQCYRELSSNLNDDTFTVNHHI